jgi:hypothetical protein
MDDELRVEAERLVDLDDRGLLIEAVTAWKASTRWIWPWWTG